MGAKTAVDFRELFMSAFRTPTLRKVREGVLAYEQAVQGYDFDKVDSLHTPDARSPTYFLWVSFHDDIVCPIPS